ncbi:MAG: hypothetical protein ABIQ03_11580, partial [Burkholderiales bacterium]
LHRPRLHAPIARTRLFRVLASARREQPFIWVAGPPGAGKTTLIGSYLEARHSRYLWYQIDPGDSDPATFFFYLGDLDANVWIYVRFVYPSFVGLRFANLHFPWSIATSRILLASWQGMAWKVRSISLSGLSHSRVDEQT